MTSTQPLTPPECDLRDYPWMPLDVRRLLTSETWVLGTAEQKVAAFTLWAESWCQVPAGSLSADDRMLAHLSGAGSAWKRVREHVLRGWIKCSDGRLYHPVVCEKANEAWERKLAQRARTEAARAAREAKRSKSTESDVPPVATSVTNPVTDVPSEVATTSVTDIATESTLPEQNVPSKKERTPHPSGVAPAARKSRVDPDWWPDASGQAKAEEVGVRNLAAEVARFRDHHAAKGSLMADWPAAWRTWCGNVRQFSKPQQRFSPGPRGAAEVFGLLPRDDEPEQQGLLQ